MKKKYNYGEIVAVGRKLHRYENLLNNIEQCENAYSNELGHINDDAFETITGPVVKLVARYRCIYQQMLDSIYKI